MTPPDPAADDDTALLLQDLASPDVQDRVAVLKVLVEDPTGDARILAALEALLQDRSACLLALPRVYGELRWLAAQALVRELEQAGAERELHLTAVPAPLTAADLAHRAAAAGLHERMPPLQCFEVLRRDGALPLSDLVLQTRRAPG